MATLFSTEMFQDRVGEDRISELPDDIIFTFLFPLELKEAVKTSILSKRWRYLWAMRAHLDFNHLAVLPEIDPNLMNILDDVDIKSKYINWINQVVDLHCGPCVDTFRVWFRFDSSDTHHIEKWVRFALSKKVKNLELNLCSYFNLCTIGLDTLKSSLVEGDISFLVSLHLMGVNVSEEFIEYLLSRCCLLERLHVEGSHTLLGLKVIGLPCKLKQLTIRSCRNLEELEVDAVNLVKFDYYTTNSSAKLVCKRMPMLIEAAFGGYCWDASVSIFQQISHVTAQLSKLSLNLMYSEIPTRVLPTFSNLKQLNLQVCFEEEFGLVSITHFFEACPALRELMLEVSWCSPVELQGEAYELRNEIDLEEYFKSVLHIQRKTHTNLEVLQIVGFSGCDEDVEFILYFVKFASNLETIICDPNPGFYDSPLPAEVIEVGRSRAGKLVKMIPPKISVVIK